MAGAPKAVSPNRLAQFHLARPGVEDLSVHNDKAGVQGARFGSTDFDVETVLSEVLRERSRLRRLETVQQTRKLAGRVVSTRSPLVDTERHEGIVVAVDRFEFPLIHRNCAYHARQAR